MSSFGEEGSKQIQMKPIKILLSLFAVVLVAVGAWGQGVIPTPGNPVGVQCGGGIVARATITPLAPTTPFDAGCATVTLFAELVDLNGNIVSTGGTAGSVQVGTLGTPAAPAVDEATYLQNPLRYPSGPLNNVFIRYRSGATAGGCVYSLLSQGPGFNVGTAVAAPSGQILSSLKVCQGTPITAQPNTCAPGTSLKLYVGDAPVTGINNPPVATPTVGTFELWAVCAQDAPGICETPKRTKVTFEVVAPPLAPSSHTLSKTTLCVAEVASTTLTIIGHNCLASEQPFVSTSASGVPELGLAGAPFAAPSTTTAYFSFCKNTTIAGCNSSGTAATPAAGTVTVNPTPINPFGLSLSKTSAPCPTNVGTLSVTATCSGSGESMEVYTAATGGSRIAFGPAPANVATALLIPSVPTGANSSTTYYVQCVTDLGCPSGRVVAGTFTVGPAIVAPTAPILSATTVCVGTPITAGANTCPAGTTLKLYTTATGTGVNNPPIATPVAGDFSLWAVCDAGSGCESTTRTKVDFKVVDLPGAPAAHTLNQIVVCTAQVAATTLRITGHNCLVSEQPFVSTSATGSPELGLAGATFAAPSATTNYFSFCKNTATGCNSLGTAGITVTVNLTPINPFGLSLSKNSAPCPTNVGTLSVTATCAGSGETMEVYTAATGGAPVVFGPAPANMATTLAIAAVPTGANSTTTYYVQCVSAAPASCPSTRVIAGTFTVGAAIAAPTAPILSATTVCVGTPITAAANTCPAGTTLKLYTAASPGTGVNNPPIATPTAGDFSLWAVCDAGSGCESTTRTKVDFKVIALPGAPAAHTLNQIAVCSAQASATTLSITAHNCLVGEQPFVSTSATGSPELGLAGATFTAPSATTNYFSFCKNTVTGCNSTGTVGITVTVNTTPINPFGFSLSKTSAPCPSNVGTLSVTATCAGSGESMEVYTVATGGTPVVFGPAPANVATTLAIAAVPKVANSTTTYYVQCVSAAPASCPSTRLMVGTFTVGADIVAPTAPILSATTVCVGTPITAGANTCPAGTTLKLYTTATGTGVNNAPIATPTAGDFSLWAVCDAGSGCETSTRTKVDFKVIALPGAPAAHALNQIAVCSAQAAATTLRITGHNCLVSEQPFVSTSATGSPVLGLAGATFTAPSATTAYFSFCKNTVTGCNSTGTAGLSVTVNLTPIDPFGLSLSKNSAPCPSNVGTLSVTATCAGSGESMEVYTAATGGAPVVFGPAPANTATTLLIPSVPSTANSTTTYYVQCVSAAPASCPSGRILVGSFTVGADIAAPTLPILSATSVCQGTAITAGANTCPAGTTLKLYTTATGTGVNNAPIATPTAGTFSLWAVCDAGSGCETKARTKVDFTVVAQPAAPAGSLNSTAYCASEAATKQLQIASHTCAVSEVPFVSAKNDGSNPLGVGGVAFAAPGVTTTYFLFCRNGNTNCISTGTALPTVTVNPNPIDPFGLSLSKTSSPCPSAVAPLSVSATCSGIGETMEVYTSATGGTPLVFGTANVGTTTTLSIPAASIPTAPSTTFYVQCKAATGCLSNRIMVSTPFTVGADIPAGTVTFTQSTVCVGTPITVASTTCPAGTTPKFYTTATGTGTTTMPSPTPSEGSYSLWVVCATSTGCESTVRTKVDYKVDYLRNAPVLGVNTGVLCFGTSVTFTVTHSCLVTDELRLYNGSTLASTQTVKASPMTFTFTPTSANSSTNSNSYTVTCFNGTCEGGKSLAVNLTVNPSPTAPTFTGTEPLIPSSICALSPSLVLNNSLKCATASEVLVWYNAATGGSVVTTPNVTPTSTTTYYVACRSTSTNACESPTRTVATFTVNPTAAAPSNASITLDGVTVAAGATPAQICDIAGNTISFSSACASSETMWISVDGGNYSMTAVTQIVDGAFHTYRVRCQLGTGATACPGPESAAMMVKINPIPVAPVAALFANGNAIGTICAGGTAMTLTSNSTCGSNQTVWFDASNNNQLASLPTTTSTATGTYSYFARCVGAGGCQSANSNTVTYTVLPVLPQATVTSSAAGVVCAGTAVTFTQNCPAGSTPQWSTGSTDNVLSITLQGAGSQSVFVKCIQSGYCDSPQSAVVTASWSSTFDITLINVGSSQSGTKGTSGTAKSAWASQFITVDAGPSLASSSQGNPSIYFSENLNKIAPRYWTAHVETCNLGTNGSVGFDMLCTPEIGAPLSFNTVENNAPYLMYANRDGFTELYSQNNPFFGFYAGDPLSPGKNAYDSGFPKGLYKLSVRYWSQKGLGIAPATRVPQGTQLAYSEYWFRIQSKNGVGQGAAREGVIETSEMEFALVAPNPVTRTLTVSINGAKGQEVKLNLVDAAGRIIKSSSVTPETNTHREEVDMSNQNTGMYFMNVSTSTKRANLKVLKVSQD
jgi:hypothetical protein